jgi:predicted metal-dependent HD superfamily phosphohydrolase
VPTLWTTQNQGNHGGIAPTNIGSLDDPKPGQPWGDCPYQIFTLMPMSLPLYWRRTWQWGSGGKADPPAGFWAEILRRYGEPHRAYHTLSHLTQGWGWLEQLPLAPGELFVVGLAWWCHDGIYDPGAAAGENEAHSSQWARPWLERGGLEPEQVARVMGLIRGTAHGLGNGPIAPPGDPLLPWLLDVDLSILGADPQVFRVYEAQIRQEYGQFSLGEFSQGRSALVRQWLDRPYLYQTAFLRDRLEGAARENLRGSLDRWSRVGEGGNT